MSAILRALAALIAFALPAAARDGILAENAYARFSARSGAIFMTISNFGPNKDRLIAARTDAAERAAMHTNSEDAIRVMQMLAVPEGFVIPGMGSLALARGGDHILMTGLTRPLRNGDTITVTLTFGHEGKVVIDVPVDSDRKDADSAHGGHGMTHGTEGN